MFTWLQSIEFVLSVFSIVIALYATIFGLVNLAFYIVESKNKWFKRISLVFAIVFFISILTAVVHFIANNS